MRHRFKRKGTRTSFSMVYWMLFPNYELVWLFFCSTLFMDSRTLYNHGCQNDGNNRWRCSPGGNRQEAVWVISLEPWVLITSPGIVSQGMFPLESLFYPAGALGWTSIPQTKISGLQESSQHLPLPYPAAFSISCSSVVLLTLVNPNSEAMVIISWNYGGFCIPVWQRML